MLKGTLLVSIAPRQWADYISTFSYFSLCWISICLICFLTVTVVFLCAASNLNENAHLDHLGLHRRDIAWALAFDGFEPSPVGLGRAAHILLVCTPSYWGRVRKYGEPCSRCPWPPVTEQLNPSVHVELGLAKVRRNQPRGRATRPRASRDPQRGVTISSRPKIQTAIPIITSRDYELSTSGRGALEEEKEEETIPGDIVITREVCLIDSLSSSHSYSPSTPGEGMRRSSSRSLSPQAWAPVLVGSDGSLITKEDRVSTPEKLSPLLRRSYYRLTWIKKGITRMLRLWRLLSSLVLKYAVALVE